MKRLYIVSTLAILSLGCRHDASTTAASAQALRPKQEEMIQQIEALPPQQRLDFAAQHRVQLITYAQHNRKFSDRMDAAMGNAWQEEIGH